MVKLSSTLESSRKDKRLANSDNIYDKRLGKMQEEINQEVSSLSPVDEEDLTRSYNDNGSYVTKFADRSYSHQNFSGKGYKILRKNIKPVSLAVTEIVVSSVPTSDGYLAFIINGIESHVDVVASSDTTTDKVAEKIAEKLSSTMTEYEVSKDTSTITLTRKFGGEVSIASSFSAVNTGASCSITDSTKQEFRNILMPTMINQPNTIYEIRYDFYLNGHTIEMQEGCTLKFEGGSLINGTCKLNNTKIKNASDSINCKLDGSISGNTIYASWFGVKSDSITDDTESIQKAFNNGENLHSKIVFEGGLGYSIVKKALFLNLGKITSLEFKQKRPTGNIRAVGENYTILTLTGGDCNIKNLSVGAFGQKINGIYWKAYAGICTVMDLAAYKCKGFGLKIESLWDSCITNTYISECGSEDEYALSIIDGEDTTNHCLFNRIQVELSYGKSMFVGYNTLHCQFLNIHSERCTAVKDLITYSFYGIIYIKDFRLQCQSEQKATLHLNTLGTVEGLRVENVSTYLYGSTRDEIMRIQHCSLQDTYYNSLRNCIIKDCNIGSLSLISNDGILIAVNNVINSLDERNTNTFHIIEGCKIKTLFAKSEQSIVTNCYINNLNVIYNIATIKNSYIQKCTLEGNNTKLTLDSCMALDNFTSGTLGSTSCVITNSTTPVQAESVTIKDCVFDNYQCGYNSEVHLENSKIGSFYISGRNYVFLTNSIINTLQIEDTEFFFAFDEASKLLSKINDTRLFGIPTFYNFRTIPVGTRRYYPFVDAINDVYSVYTGDCWVTNKGTSEQRPNTYIEAGFEYYDTTIKKKILWNGTDWVNMDGTELVATASNEQGA